MRALSLSGRPVVVTCAGHGLGRDVALALAERRAIVFGTANSAREVEELRRTSNGRVSLIVCGMEQMEMVDAWASGVCEAIGGSGLDLLISTAVHLPAGPMEAIPMSELQHDFAVNIFGGLAVINAFLPALRKAQGRIVQLSSCPSDKPDPFAGPSRASQAAMDAFLGAYRAELEPFGVDVVIASTRDPEAGDPEILGRLGNVDNGMSAAHRNLYGRQLRNHMAQLAAQATGDEPIAVAAKVIDLAIQSVVPPRAEIDCRT